MRLEFNYGSRVMTLPAAAEKSINSAGKRELKTLLFFAAEPALLSELDTCREDIAKTLGMTPEELDGAISFWRGAGVMAESNEPAETATAVKPKLTRDETPVYSGEELGELLSENNGSLKGLIDECQVMMEKMFNPTEVGKIVGLSSYLRLEHEYILMLFSYCCTRDKRSVAYVEKMAYSLYNDGIMTVAQLNAHLREREVRESVAGKLRKLFGIGERAFTRKENNCIKAWVTDWKFGYEMIERAYEITVDNINEYSIDYLNKVLLNWHTEGYTTTDEVEVALASYKKNKEASQKKEAAKEGGSFDTNDFFERALKRSYDAQRASGKK